MTFQKISKKALIDICCINCINKTKIDELFPNSQSRWMGTSFPQFNVIEIIEVAGKYFFVIFLHIDHQIAKIEILLRKSQIHEIRP